MHCVTAVAATTTAAMTPIRLSGRRVTGMREDPREGKNWVIGRRPVASRKRAD
jgi:hypothetical protein